MVKPLIGVCAACVMSSIAAVAVSGSGASTTPSTNPYESRYERNVAGLGLPDQTFDNVLPPNADLGMTGFVAPGQSSRTCSSTCSKTCSTTCTTTRGCKTQTQGCQGTTTAPATTQPAKSSALPAGSVLITPDLNARTVVNAQRALVIAGYQGLCVTGAEGSPDYKAALVDFQRRQSLTASGEVNDATWAKFQQLLLKASR